MPLGAPTTAPAGFLDLCSRSPDDCAEPGVALSEVRSQAQKLFWASLFDVTSQEPASVSVAGTPDRGTRFSPQFGSPAAEPQRLTRTPRHLAGNPASGSPSSTPVSSAVETRLMLTKTDWDRIDGVNRDINRHIRDASDLRQYGVSDYWTEPTGRAPRGDCEDYVIAKRRALIALGYPQSALSIALVVTPWGEDHAVLLMATTQGEVVLDNLAQRIVTWDRTDYTWAKRQEPGRSLAWRSIG